MVNNNEISVIIQGAINTELTHQCLKSVRKHLPNAEIILSTFKSDTDIPASLYDKLIINDDIPVQFYSTLPKEKQNNVNRQIASTLNGLRAATHKYAFKIRTDFILQSDKFLKYFNLYQQQDKQYTVFQHKILSCTNFARNPQYLLFHPSDMAFFGLRDDLINLFDVPFMSNEEEIYYKFDGHCRNKYVPEQHLWINCLNKNGHNIDFNRFETPSDKNITDTEKYFASNFIFLSWKQFELCPPSKFFELSRIYDYLSCVTHCEWLKWYKKYLAPDIVAPRDSVRADLEKFQRRHRVALFVARIGVLPLFAFPSWRRRSRSKLYDIGYKIFTKRLYKRICTEL